MQSTHVITLSAMKVAIRLWRWRVVHGAHQCCELCMVQSLPLMSNDPQLVQWGGGGVGMWECD